jgi:hypothetical protein
MITLADINADDAIREAIEEIEGDMQTRPTSQKRVMTITVEFDPKPEHPGAEGFPVDTQVSVAVKLPKRTPEGTRLRQGRAGLSIDARGRFGSKDMTRDMLDDKNRE